MALVIQFQPKSMDAAHYDEVIRRLQAAGAGAPEGRLHHVCFGDPHELRVIDIWTSQASFDRFGQVLMPILQEVGVDPGQPDIQETHNIIRG